MTKNDIRNNELFINGKCVGDLPKTVKTGEKYVVGNKTFIFCQRNNGNPLTMINGEIIEEPVKPCPKCNEMPTSEGCDACLGKLPGVVNACCGHGVEEGYIEFENGKLLFFKELRAIEK